ncbi:Class II abasic (AP) endonuclease [Lithohypha guttulata]|uniref:DNA-(apurinic or apyrimidinic site) endonuclease 2 n=1 Tax=Lithohypha guttulata TaxID=1690604 RepID=A0ABR0JY97_9EURO|nr:Class II abasic (AP) endonuclease [Lithohypha guttulata]
MALRITTWNVNGIRNPFGYQPWRDKRTFEAMFDILEADIVCFQETKIQRKDLRDDMVLVPGFDCYWSLPRHKKGYAGVVIYTRNSRCAPIRAEEGIAGGLCPPNSTTPFRELPEEEQIGGYPTLEQMSQTELDAATLDAEGRCVILEFPAFVLLGTYCPAERDEERTHFRTAFLKVLDARIRNLVKMGKRVVWVGDINISREEIDTAMSEESMRKRGVDHVGWISSPARRLFNQLLVGGKVYGERDEGREEQILWDVCRSFHEGRKGMYTCWETKVNARPGNYGSRIDYVLCTHEMKDWWSDSNIQEGLMGSDHCPVYGTFKEKVTIQGQEKHILDLVNPPGVFEDGVRKMDWSTKHLLPMSGKLIQEFDRRRNIKDMFSKKPSLPKAPSSIAHSPSKDTLALVPTLSPSISFTSEQKVNPPAQPIQSPNASALKRSISNVSTPPAAKKSKSDSNGTSKGQQSLKGFFAKKPSLRPDEDSESLPSSPEKEAAVQQPTPLPILEASPARTEKSVEDEAASFEVKKTWGKLFAKPIAPKCEHDEPCKTMLTKKPGVNCGRSFWMCNRPLGPSGKQERGTQWRCNTFIWASDWDARQDPG